MPISLLLIIALISGAVYLILDALETAKLAALQELCRLAFAMSLLAWCLGAVK